MLAAEDRTRRCTKSNGTRCRITFIRSTRTWPASHPGRFISLVVTPEPARHGVRFQRQHDLVGDRPHQLALDIYRPREARYSPVLVFFDGGDSLSLFVISYSVGALLAGDGHRLAGIDQQQRQLARFIDVAGPYDLQSPKYHDFIKVLDSTQESQPHSQSAQLVDGNERPILMMQSNSDPLAWPRHGTSPAAVMNRESESFEVQMYPDTGQPAISPAMSRPCRAQGADA